MRKIKRFKITLTQSLKAQMLNWAQKFNEVIWLDSNQHKLKHTSFKAILAVDAFTSIKTGYDSAFNELEEYQAKTKDWLFGYLTYDLKNDLENLNSSNFDGLQFPDLFFFQPKKLFLFSENEVEILYLNLVDDELENDWKEILKNKSTVKYQSESQSGEIETKIKIHLRTSKESYFKKIDKILQHIHRGDIYEVNFCQEFYSKSVKLDPVRTYIHLNNISKPPFATFLKLNDHYVLSASPERYICKSANIIVSQPIKGTARRYKEIEKDLKQKKNLADDPKERSENIMITDLVRNDLSRFAKKGSVVVEELCKVYTFEKVHHLISTITCQVTKDISPVRILKDTFPMGSMTGTPKISAMNIIEKFEDTKRGLYSGTVGYFSPEGDFDFNVIIRSILYNKSNQYVSFSVGGAITAKSIPENEYEECLLKAKAMREVLES